MIKDIEELRGHLRLKYLTIFAMLRQIRVGSNDLSTIISKHLVMQSGKKPIELVSSHDISSIPLRIQIKDLSGIGANSFGYYIANMWAERVINTWK